MIALVVVASLAAVHTNITEVRACYPLGGGEFLVGTGGGLVRVDERGQARAVWTAVDGLPGTRIDAIAKDGDQLWIGTEAGAAAVTFDGDNLAITRIVETKPVRDVVTFGGATYVATWEGGVKKAGKAMPFRGGNHPPNRSRVSSLAVADGALWAGTSGGLYKLTNGTFELVTIATGANEVTSLLGDGKTLWIATTAGLYTREGSTVRSYGGGDLRRVARVDGTIVVGGFGGELVRVERGRLVRTDLARGLAMPQAISERDGAACAGGLDGLYLRPRKDAAWISAKRPSGLPANDVSAIAADGDRLWVGTFDHGVAVLERGAWRTLGSRNIDPRVNAVLVEKRANMASRIWVGTATGISLIDGDNVTQLTKRDGLPARGVLSLAQLRDGRILAGTMNGAVIIGDGRPVPLGVKQNVEVKNVWAVAEDADGYLWLGTTTGVYRGRESDAAWTRYSVATGHLRDDWVMALAVKGSAVWVGTYKGGVTRFAYGAAGVSTTALGDGWINPGGLTWIGERLYASTMEGLRIGDGESAAWTTLGKLPGRDTTAVAAVGDRLWVSTRRGLWTRRADNRPGYPSGLPGSPGVMSRR
ncbi:MAG: two-component regulator propeller domain-containing protein [Kofleriaceae bacterium]|nr:two-component regulator propeller domain-containing protein [Kofleriaceae bacterium]